jgi:hypothetical protein
MTKNAHDAKIAYLPKSVYPVYLVCLVYLVYLVSVALDQTDQMTRWTKGTEASGRPYPKAPSARGGDKANRAQKPNTGADFQGPILVARLLLKTGSCSHIANEFEKPMTRRRR